jgi:hypothetical protein
MALSYETKIVIPQDTLINMVDGEAVILSLKSERYFGLNKVGTRMWTALTSNASIQAAYDALLAEYDVEGERLRLDLNDLLEKLLERGLIEIDHEGKA